MERGEKTGPLEKSQLQALVVKYLLWFIAAVWVYSFSFVINNYLSKRSSPESVTSSFQERLAKKENEFFRFIQEKPDLLLKFSNSDYADEDIAQIQQLHFHLFLFADSLEQKHLVFWSTNQVVPPISLAQSEESGRLFRFGNGHYEVLRKTVIVGGRKLQCIGLILLHREYFIDNARLKKEFPDFNSLEGHMLFSTEPGPYAIKSYNDETLFYLNPGMAQPFKLFSWFSFAIQLLSFVILVFLVSNIANYLIKGGKELNGFIVYCSGFLLLWLLIRQLGIPVNLDQFTWLKKSETITLPPTALLNLLQNSLFIFWLGLFLTFQAQHVGSMLTGLNYKLKAFISILLTGCAIAVHFGIIEKICKLYLSSTVAFDFNNFFSLDYTTIIAFLVLFLILTAHLMLVRFFTRSLLFITGGNIRFVLLSLLAAGFIALSVGWFLHFRMQLLFSMIWLAAIAWFFCRYPRAAFPISTGRMVAWLLVYAISVGLLLSNLAAERLRNRINEIGKTLLMQNDQTSEYLVRFASGGIRKLNWHGFMEESRDSARGAFLRDSITSKHFGGYLNRFVTRIYLFDDKRAGIHNQYAESFESLNTLFQNNKKEEGFPWVSFFEESFDNFGYIIRFEIANPESTDNEGYVFVVVRSVVMRNSMMAPELFRQLQNFAIELPPGFSYAWYKNGRLIEQYRNYPFPAVLPAQYNQQPSQWMRDTSDADESWMNAGANTVLAIAGERRIALGMVSMVAYIFCAFLVIYMVVRLVGGLVPQRNIGESMFKPLFFSIQAQIRLTIVSILGLSFLLVAYITINFFVNQFRKGNEDRLSKASEAVSAELVQKLPPDFLTLNSDMQKSLVANEIADISKNLNTDINFYDTLGQMMSSTQNVLFVKQVISDRLNPVVYYNLTKGKVNRQITTESIGNLSYTSIYQPLRNSDGKLSGFVQLPYFASQSELKQEISNFVVILINIIAFVFLLSGALAFLISGSITRSFAIIAEKMNHLRLSEKNERIEWSGKNEIGNLVEQYNRMVDQLEASASKLAQSEREMAWREMARQVAHEIKNPLTPMKLSLQFLQKAIKENPEGVARISEKVASNLVSQIDHLARIAFEFSQFANIGNVKPQTFDLHDVLRDLVLMYEMQENLEISWGKYPDPIIVSADRTQMNRLFTNLLQNAVEAGGNGKPAQVVIIEKVANQKLLIEISDNGTGIPIEIQPRIFMPNFTTKSSGTGLGLAICKAIVEKANGQIWFRTTAGDGTTFYVELPLST